MIGCGFADLPALGSSSHAVARFHRPARRETHRVVRDPARPDAARRDARNDARYARGERQRPGATQGPHRDDQAARRRDHAAIGQPARPVPP